MQQSVICDAVSCLMTVTWSGASLDTPDRTQHGSLEQTQSMHHSRNLPVPADPQSSALTLAGADRPHPIWGVKAPNVAGYIRLLQYLCGEELMRLRVWTEPLKHADSSRSLPVVRGTGWGRLCSSCGQGWGQSRSRDGNGKAGLASLSVRCASA